MKKQFVILVFLLLTVIFAAGCIQEPETPPPHQPPVIPETPDAPPPPTFKSVDEYLSLLNEYYSLGLTEEEILQYADELDTGYLKDARHGDGGIWVDDVVGFQTEGHTSGYVSSLPSSVSISPFVTVITGILSGMRSTSTCPNHSTPKLLTPPIIRSAPCIASPIASTW